MALIICRNGSCSKKFKANYHEDSFTVNGLTEHMDVGSIIKEGGTSFDGHPQKFSYSVRNCFGEPRVAVNELETR